VLQWDRKTVKHEKGEMTGFTPEGYNKTTKPAIFVVGEVLLC